MMQIINLANELLQRIADHGNWLTSDEVAPVRDSYNSVVSVFICLERACGQTFGWDNLKTRKTSPAYKKSVLDFLKWKEEGDKLCSDLAKFIMCTKLKYAYDSDEEVVKLGASKIYQFDKAVLNMEITVPSRV